MGTVSGSVKVGPFSIGPQLMVIATLTPSNSYATGGETVKASTFGLSTINCIIPCGNGGGLKADFVQSNGKLKFYQDVTAHTHGLLVTGGQGAGTALQYTPDSAAGILGKTTATSFTIAGGASNIQNATAVNSGTEVAATQDLSGSTMTVVIIGT